MLRRVIPCVLGSVLLVAPVSAQAQEARRRFEEVRRFDAREATQAVAVDDTHFYAITNREIGKYDKRSGELAKRWEGPAGGPIIHLDSGVVLDGQLICAHSNYPGVPMASSIEIWDTRTLEHVDSHSIGIFAGSATWIDRWDGHWWVAFANCAGNGGVPGRGPEWTTLVKFDAQWHPVAGYTYPRPVVERFGTMSNSGGTWAPDGRLYTTGHDNAEIYVLSLPKSGSVLVLDEILPIVAEGQGIAWDWSEPGTMYSILRSRAQVVVSRLRP
jgi:hypothetical protein